VKTVGDKVVRHSLA